MSTVLLGRICRTCLGKSADMHKLREFMADDLQIESMLHQTVPNFDLELNEVALPVEICKECLNKLQISYDFVKMCLRSNKDLENILNQQEQEIEASCVASELDVNAMETDILMDSLQKELFDGICIESQGPDNIGVLSTSPSPKKDNIKVEIEIRNISDNGDQSSAEKYWPDDDKDDSDSNFFKNVKKKDLDIKPKKKYTRRGTVNVVKTKTCLHCKKVFSKRDLLLQHLSVHDSENQFVCYICDYRFSSERKLKIHISCKHKGVAKSINSDTYPRPDCPKIFQEAEAEASAGHLDMHSQEKFKCHLCEKSFPAVNHLNDHINDHMGYKKYKCDQCEKSYTNNTALKDHVRVHTGESPFLCSHCGKSFKTATILRQHVQRHGEKKFHCPECPMKFYVKVNLIHHMTSHSTLKPHVCDICGSAFTRQDSLKAHKFKHSGERPFKCEVCKMSFVFKRLLNRHRITHTGEKPHMCNYCDRAYAASGDLVKHLRTHLGEKTYICDQCPEAFKYSLDLKHHKNRHYKEKLNLEQQKLLTVGTPTEVIIMHPEDTIVKLEEMYEVDKNSEVDE